MPSKEIADLWVVGGAPAAGKTTVSSLLIENYPSPIALLDKDTIYEDFDKATLEMSGRTTGDREGDWYKRYIKPLGYAGLTATAREIRENGCPVLLSAPFTTQIHNADIWHDWVDQLGGERIHLAWVQTDASTLRRNMDKRNSPRDADKYNDFDTFLKRVKIDSPPPVEHFTIDNRMNASKSLEAQVVQMLEKVLNT